MFAENLDYLTIGSVRLLLRPPREAPTPPPAPSSRPTRDRVIEFGKHRGQMLGTLPPSYLRWVAAELDYGDTAPWGRLECDVLDDRVEWEHAHRFLCGDADYDYAYDDGDGPLQEMAERFDWDLSYEEGWSHLDFRLLGTSYDGCIPRKGGQKQNSSSSKSRSPGSGSLFDVGDDQDDPRGKWDERRERVRLRREEQVRAAKMGMLGVNAGVADDGGRSRSACASVGGAGEAAAARDQRSRGGAGGVPEQRGRGGAGAAAEIEMEMIFSLTDGTHSK